LLNDIVFPSLSGEISQSGFGNIDPNGIICHLRHIYACPGELCARSVSVQTFGEGDDPYSRLRSSKTRFADPTTTTNPFRYSGSSVSHKSWDIHKTGVFWNGAEWRLCGQSNGSKLMFQFRLYPLNRGWHGVRSASFVASFEE
jgi:hypothetical protein